MNDPQEAMIKLIRDYETMVESRGKRMTGSEARTLGRRIVKHFPGKGKIPPAVLTAFQQLQKVEDRVDPIPKPTFVATPPRKKGHEKGTRPAKPGFGAKVGRFFRRRKP